MTKLATKLAKKLARTLDSVGHITQQPPVWAGFAAALAAAGGPRGREAAARGSVCYAAAAVVGNLVVKPLVRRPRPPEAGEGRVGPVTTSFPSGHAASDLAFAFGVAQVLPLLLVPLSGATLTAHWSLVRTRGHYAGDVLLGGALGIGVALAVRRLWPITEAAEAPAGTGPGGAGAPAGKKQGGEPPQA